MRRVLWIICACLAILQVLSGNTLTEVQDPSLGTQQANPISAAAAGNNTYFIANEQNVGSGATSNIVGWFYNPATSLSTAIEAQDPSLGTQLASPFNIKAAGNNTFFITNIGTIGSGGTSNIVGWFYNPATIPALTTVHDTSLGTQQATPFNLAVAGNNTFFVVNSEAIGGGLLSNIVGWFYNNLGSSTIIEVQDSSIGTKHAMPLKIVTGGNNNFFIAHSGGVFGGFNIVGWYYDTSTLTLTEVLDLSIGTQRGNPDNIAAGGLENDTFFITNFDGIGSGGDSDIVGWLYDHNNLTLTEVKDLSLGTQSALPDNVVAAGNDTFFINNVDLIGSGGTSSIVGWFYNPATSLTTVTEVQDPSLGTEQARPFNIVAAGNNTFFITNIGTIGSGGTSNIVGWFYNPAAIPALTTVHDPSLGTQQGRPNQVVAEANDTFFISNSGIVGSGGTGNIIGWVYDPAASVSTATEVQDPSLGTQQAAPGIISEAENGTIFIANGETIGSGGGTSNIVGWLYNPATSTLVEGQDPSLGTQEATPSNVVTADNNFFIANSEPIGSGALGDIVGWYFSSALPPSSIQGSSRRNRFLTQTDHFNQIQWTAPSGISPSGYMIFRDAALTDRIATLPNTVFEYLDHNRMPKHLYSYFVVAVQNGSLSTPIEITIYVP
ncbi:MAG TPA: hypothetical protein VLG76_01720 [Rhabdochlamydiaceae bacterium]|nr:hypothetical protein [Rhabdochlamydiaceae bacterium]